MAESFYIHRVKLLRYKEIMPTGRLTFHHAIVRANKTINKEL